MPPSRLWIDANKFPVNNRRRVDFQLWPDVYFSPTDMKFHQVDTQVFGSISD